VTFVTGHDVATTDWSKTAGTVVIFMGLMHLREAAAGLIAAGRMPHTPAIAVRWATRPDQQTVEGTLATLPERCEQAGMKPPATVIVGDVVGLRSRLDWYGRKPLLGLDVIVTRARAQAVGFSAGLRELGACPIELPVIELAPLDDYSALDAAIAHLDHYDWIVFTSTNAVDYFLLRLKACKRDVRAIRGKLCAIGPATRDALEAAHLIVDLVPDEHIAEGVAKAFEKVDVRDPRVLLPRAVEARELIPKTLTSMGADVDVVDAYRNIVPRDAQARIAEYLRRGKRADWITFTSGSTVKNWLALAGRDSLEGVRVASIGPATSDVLRKHGVSVDAEADPHTTDALLEVIRR
jgi:uroporphyrinogen III methyltransferase/synthase